MEIHFLVEKEFWARCFQIVLIDLVLAGDNALVIALAVRKLSTRDQFWGRVWGTGGAVVLRLAFVAIVTVLLRIPFLQLAGGLVLIWIAVKLVLPSPAEEDHARHGGTLGEAIRIIIVADVAMSLDNVIAVAGAAKGDFKLVVFGLLLSIPLVVWGSGLLAKLMNHFPIIIWAGGGVLGFVAGHMILEDPWMIERTGSALKNLHRVAPAILGVAVAVLGWWTNSRAVQKAK